MLLRKLDEITSRNQPLHGVAPADQRFGADHAVAVNVHLGLVVQLQLTAVCGTPQLAAQRHLFKRLQAQLRRCKPKAGLGLLLQARMNGGQRRAVAQITATLAISGSRGNTHPGARPHLVTAYRNGLAQGCQQPACRSFNRWRVFHGLDRQRKALLVQASNARQPLRNQVGGPQHFLADQKALQPGGDDFGQNVGRLLSQRVHQLMAFRHGNNEQGHQLVRRIAPRQHGVDIGVKQLMAWQVGGRVKVGYAVLILQESQCVANTQHQLARVHWLGQKVGGAQFQGAQLGLGSAFRRQHDDGRGSQQAVVAHRLQQLEARQVGHQHVQQQQVRLFQRHHCDGFARIVGENKALVARTSEILLHQCGHQRIVVDHHDFGILQRRVKLWRARLQKAWASIRKGRNQRVTWVVHFVSQRPLTLALSIESRRLVVALALNQCTPYFTARLAVKR